jgi:type I restriction enzyme S subunit
MREGWEYKRLGEVASFINGYAFKPEQWTSSGTPIVRIQNLNNPDAPFNYYDGEVPDKVKIKDGDLLISWSASLGAYIWQGGDAFLNQHIFKVEFDKLDIDKIYLKYAVISKLNMMAGLVHGATMKHIVKKDFDNTCIPYPPINEQKDIVRELDKINELISLKKSQLEDLDSLAQSIFYDMFGDPIENEKGWEVKKLGEIFETSSGGTPSKSHNEYYEGGTIPWLRSGEVSQGFISETEMYITEAGLNNSSAKFFPPNTVVVAMYGATVGQVGVIKKKMTTNQAICGIFPNEDYSSTFMFYFLIGMKPLYLRNAAGGAQPNISQGIIKNTLIPIVPLPLQLEFEKRIERIEQQKQQISSAIKDLETLLASRMQYWFD